MDNPQTHARPINLNQHSKKPRPEHRRYFANPLSSSFSSFLIQYFSLYSHHSRFSLHISSGLIHLLFARVDSVLLKRGFRNSGDEEPFL
ncbi:hypothetical protein JTE90_006497 [Oedothorax gibbosus]|uniref:Uncharacterized protein n=1 Tax=Oedothorax gibbosus TaxID=931172 RepID=A0AAV6VM72_9ARAC|nr:hypothetical protein JTE90_006497 [Oedothorax gibbosus]